MKHTIPPLAVLAVVFIGCSTPQATAQATPSPTPEPTALAHPPATPVPTVIPSPTPLPDRITDAHGVTMILVPAGDFIMGRDDGLGDERPAHSVHLDDYYIDLTEVTNGQYRACVSAGVCAPPARTDCCTENRRLVPIWPDYYDNPEYDNYPALFISWNAAAAYCQWRGARLPTEAEWEKAARGTDERIYPWGNDDPRPDLLSFYWPPEAFPGRPRYTPAQVGSYLAGASPYGALDMAGNVYEWVQDWYAADYYAISPYENPTGPAEGNYKVSRGGSFFNLWSRQRATGRNNAYLPPESFHFDGGMRCAMDAPAP